MPLEDLKSLFLQKDSQSGDLVKLKKVMMKERRGEDRPLLLVPMASQCGNWEEDRVAAAKIGVA